VSADSAPSNPATSEAVSTDSNLVELDHALRKLRLSGMADVLDARLRLAQTEKLAPLEPRIKGHS
jgi:hypothetical protein